MSGAAFLAIHSKALTVPVTVTGTENWRVLQHSQHLQRLSFSLTIGPAFHLTQITTLARRSAKEPKLLCAILRLSYL
jgi:hypothetical protein